MVIGCSQFISTEKLPFLCWGDTLTGVLNRFIILDLKELCYIKVYLVLIWYPSCVILIVTSNICSGYCGIFLINSTMTSHLYKPVKIFRENGLLFNWLFNTSFSPFGWCFGNGLLFAILIQMQFMQRRCRVEGFNGKPLQNLLFAFLMTFLSPVWVSLCFSGCLFWYFTDLSLREKIRLHFSKISLEITLHENNTVNLLFKICY